RGGVPKRPGPPTILTAEEENELVGYCLNMQQIGFGLTKEAVNTMVVQILKEKNKNQLNIKSPSDQWWKRFMRDHSQLSFRVPQELSKARAAKCNPVVIQDHFRKLEQLINKYSLTSDRIWNMDESGFNISSRLQKVLAQKGSRQVHKTVAGSSKEHVSVCPTISAAGTYIPPLLIYKGVNVIEGLLTGASVPPGTVAAFTDTGYMHEDIFRMYIEHFNNSIPPARPVLLMLDGATSHIDLTSIKYCQDKNILLY
ncbi:13928_t:CDS:1, partial [Cetraspora pellucida]